MRKLKLTLENLQVDSFDVDEGRKEEGTVHARESFGMGSCYPDCSFDTLCHAGPCDTENRTCGTCIEPHYVSQCGGPSCFEVC